MNAPGAPRAAAPGLAPVAAAIDALAARPHALPLGRLFWKIFAACWLALVAASALVGGLMWLDARTAERRVIEDSPVALVLVDAASTIAIHAGREPLLAWMHEVAAVVPANRPQLYGVDEQGRELLGRPVPAEVLAAAYAAVQADVFDAGRDRDDDDPPRRLALRQVRADGVPLLMFVTAAPTPPPGVSPRGTLRRHLPDWVVPAGTALLASLLMAALLAWYFARPIRALDGALRRAGEGDLTVRVAPGLGRRRDEVAQLGHGFDRMLQRIDALLQAQSRLLHDVSHELRSPLARLQVAAALARRDPAQAVTMLDRVELETERMDRLVEEILTLARLESDAAVAEAREAIDLAALVEDSVDDARIEAQAQRKSVTLVMHGEPQLSGQPALLQRAIDNVLRNAVQHAPEGGTVEVTVQSAPGAATAGRNAQVLVADRGPGLSEDECRQVFEPFVRGRDSRSQGFGLGLAIAQRAVQSHGGGIVARNRLGGGLLVTISLPAAA
ncbi:MAG: HAMP domain-containing histidine kinase [Burkholderiaceae bacterium]|nr:HAMP domain-containing histidine kinase [Burkholderiaceae bacterium]